MIYDAAVIGGGPAGMMAAISAASKKVKVVLIEKNNALGKKLLLTGSGRCNLTNLDPLPIFVEKFGPAGKFLYSVLKKYGSEDTLTFFKSRGLKIKQEENNRIFPLHDQSSEVLKVLVNELKKLNVECKLNSPVKNLIKGERGLITEIELENGEEIKAKNFILATGGLSFPLTGSSGDGFNWAKQLGHQLSPLSPALTPIYLKNPVFKSLAGLTLANIKITLTQNGKKGKEATGDLLFTHQGLSGPVILNISQGIGGKSNKILFLKIDLLPDLTREELDQKLQETFRQEGKKMIKNILAQFWPAKLIILLLKSAKINPGKPGNEITRLERQNWVNLIKELRVEIKGVGGFNEAMVTAGGINLAEIEGKTMQSKIIPNLYLAGEILDLTGPTGGYNLQIAWSTGYLAGTSVAS